MLRLVVLLAAALALTGCSAAASPSEPEPVAPAVQVTTAPDDGVLLTSLGFANAPAGFSVPRGTVIADRIDATNNVTLMVTQPDGEELASYLRENLAGMGFQITADGGGSLLFESGTHSGAFTVTDSLSALSLRTDQRR